MTRALRFTRFTRRPRLMVAFLALAIATTTIGLLGAPVLGPNVNVSNMAGAQTGADIAIDPTNPLHLIGASNDLPNDSFVGGLVRVYESNDRGATWTTATLPLAPAPANAFAWQPAVSFNSQGDAYVTYEGGDATRTATTVVVSKKMAGTTTWSTPVALPTTIGESPKIAIDRLGAIPNRTYVAWNDGNVDGANNHSIKVARSTDNGATFSVATVNDSGAQVALAQPAVGPDGEVYVVWSNYAFSGGRKIMVDRSTDGGATWGTDRVVHSWSAPTNGSLRLTISPDSRRGVAIAGSIDVDRSAGPRRGTVYVVYNDGSSNADYDIFLRKSTDGGVTWSAAKRVNDDTPGNFRNQFLPKVAVSDVDGSVHVTWYDSRDASPFSQVYYARSTDGGQTFEANTRITTSQSNESASGGGNFTGFGDSIGLAVSGADVQFLWTDNRLLSEDTYTAAGNYLQLIATPPSQTVAPGGVAQYSVTAIGTVSGSGSLTVAGLPSGASAVPTLVTVGGPTTLSVNTGTAAAGTYTLTLTGTIGAGTANTTVSLVIAGSGFSLSPVSLFTVPPGNFGSATVSLVALNGFSDAVSLTATDLPVGVTVTPATIPAGSTSGTLTFSATTAAPIGDNPITIVGTSGSLTRTVTATLRVIRQFELLVNGGFEGGGAHWSGFFWDYTNNGQLMHSGTGHAESSNSMFTVGLSSQQVTIPNDVTAANLTFWLKIENDPAGQQDAADHWCSCHPGTPNPLDLQIQNSLGGVVQSIRLATGLTSSSPYTLQGPYNLMAYKGQTVSVVFRFENNTGIQTKYRIDDASLLLNTLTPQLPTATALSTSANPTYGQPVTVTATVTSGGSPATQGTVIVSDGATVLGSLAVNGSGVASVSQTFSVGPHSLSAAYVENYYYGPSTGGTSMAVAPAPLTVKADDKSRVYNTPNPGFTATYTGLVGSENASVLSGTLALASTATQASPVGTYPITPSGLSSPNYAITFVGGTLTVTGTGTAIGSATNASAQSGMQMTPDIAIDPLNPGHLIGVSMDSGQAGHLYVRAMESGNGGTTWTNTALPVPASYTLNSKFPTVAFNSAGDAFVTFYASQTTDIGAIAVSKKAVGAGSWGSPVVVASTSGSSKRPLKYPSANDFFPGTDTVMGVFPRVTVDQAVAGTDPVYVAWDDNVIMSASQTLTQIKIAKSTNGGTTYGVPVKVNDNATGEYLAMPQVVTGTAANEIYVAWVRFKSGISSATIYIDRSTDGGQTWGTDRAIHTRLLLTTDNFYRYRQPFVSTGVPLSVSLDVDRSNGPNRGTVYAVYSDFGYNAFGEGTGLRVWLRRSTDLGVTWSLPVQVNEDVAGPAGLAQDHYMPKVVVSNADGSLHIVWYDSRNTVSGSNVALDLYYTRSTDGGLTFEPNTRITTASSDFWNNADSTVGDYIGLANGPAGVEAMWTDGRTSPSEIYATSIVTEDVAILASPSSQTASGGTAAYTITASGTGGYTLPLALTVVGLPSGATASFSPTSVAPGAPSTMTVNIGSAPAGTYTLTITGTIGAETRVATVSLTIVPDFSLSMTTALSLVAGASDTRVATTAVYGGFNSAVTITGPQTGAVVTTIVPAQIGAPGDGYVVIEFATLPTAAPGSYPITITATGGGKTHTATVTVTVTGTAASREYLINGGFETSGIGGDAPPWVETVNQGDSDVIVHYPFVHHSGTYSMQFGGSLLNQDASLSQTVAIPAGATSVKLSFWVRITSSETTTTALNDKLAVAIVDGSGLVHTIETLSNLDENVNFTKRDESDDPDYDISEYAGQTVKVRFRVTTNGSLATTFNVDDVSLTCTCPGADTNLTLAVTPTGTPQYGTSVNLTATVLDGGVHQVTAGTVTFTDGATTLKSDVDLDADGKASYTTKKLGVGPHSLTAHYNPVSPYVESAEAKSLPIVAAPLTVTADLASRVVGVLAPAFTGTILGIVNSDPITATYTTTATAASPVGSYPITPVLSDAGTGALDNYAVTSVNSVLEIGDFSIAATGTTTRSVLAGSSATFTIDANYVNDLCGPPSFSVSQGLPSGGTASFGAPSAGPCLPSTTTLTVNTGTAAGGTYTLTIAGTINGVSRTTTVQLTVVEFTLTPANATGTTVPGGSTSFTINIARISGGGNVDLGISQGLPAGATVVPVSAPGASGILTVTLGGSVAAGSYPLTVSGTQTSGSTSLTRTTAVTLVVQDFSLTPSPTTRTIASTNSNTYTITSAALQGFAGNVALSASMVVTSTGTPMSGGTLSFSPNTVNPLLGEASTLTFSRGTAAAGNYTITVTGTSGTLSHSVTVTLTLRDYSVTASPTSQTVTPGGTAVFSVQTAALNAYPGTSPISFSVTGLPAGVTAVFAPTSQAASTASPATMTLTANAPVVTGSYPLTVTGTSGSLTRTSAVTLVVTDFGLSANPASITVTHNGSANTAVSVSVTAGLSQVTSLDAIGLPAGVTATFSPSTLPSPGSGNTTVTFSANASAAPGAYTVTLSGTGSAGTRTADVTLTVDGTTLTTLSASPAPHGYGQAVTFTAAVAAGESAVAAGSVTFTDGASVLASNVALDVAGHASFSTSTLSAGDHTVTATYNPTSAWLGSAGMASLTIDTVPLTITTKPASRAYGVGNPVFDVTYQGFVLGQTSSALGGALTFTTSANTTSAPGPYAVTPGGLTSSNYAITFQPGTLTIDGSTVTTLAASAAPHDYGQAVTFTASVATGESAVTSGTVTFTEGVVVLASNVALDATGHASFSTSTLGAGDHTVTATYSPASGFLGSAGTASLTVAPVALSITTKPASKNYGENNPSFDVTDAGFVLGQTASALGGTLTFTTSANAISAPGPYDVTPGGLTSSNYAIAFHPGTLTVSKAVQSITFDQPAAQVYGNAPLTLSASASSNLPVGFSLVSGPATLSGNTLTFTGAGAVVVRAAQGGDTNFLAASPVDRTITVTALQRHVVGSGYTTPESPTYRGTFSVDATGPASSAGSVKYSYSRTRMNFVSTAIASVVASATTATVEGSGTVNGVAGYTFTATAGHGSPDTFGIVIRNPNGSIYYSTPVLAMSGGTIAITQP